MKTVEEIYGEMRETFAEETGMAPDDTGEMAVRMYALAAEVYGLYQQAEWTRRQCFPQTALGEDLENHAALRGLSRNPAAKARGVLRFSAGTEAEWPLPIPRGTVCMTAAGVRMETLADGEIAPGTRTAEIPAQAAEPGPGGNVPAGAVRIMAVAPEGVAACTNPAPFAGGAEREDDEALRRRVMDSFLRTPNGSNRAYYLREALAVDGVQAVCVQPKKRGLGTVDVVVSAPGGMPSTQLIQAVQKDLQEKREISVSVQVKAPEPVKVDLLVAVKPQPGLYVSPIQEKVRAAITGWFNGALLGRDVLLARLGQLIYAVEGVENYTIAEPAADVKVKENQLPVLGHLSVEELR